MVLEAKTPQATFWIRIWLVVLALMVYAMILIGGATRLTDSGLSITEWDLIRGTLPPSGEAAWAELFAKYQATSEYRLQNRGMTLSEFQYIFWWEWAHRLFGRVIGLVAVGGFAVFIWRGWMNGPLRRRALLLIALGGLQGFIGWWMVASGIGETQRVDVAPYRLMTHFMLALLIIAITAWTLLDLSTKRSVCVGPEAKLVAGILLGLTALQMAAGALVAGLDAGRTYTDWPLMAGELVPSNYDSGLGLRAFFESVAATQFNHRFLAYALLSAAVWAAWRYRKTEAGRGFAWFAGLVLLQSAWGILTLVNAAPLPLALLHQGLGVILLLTAVGLRWQLQDAPSAISADGSIKTTL